MSEGDELDEGSGDIDLARVAAELEALEDRVSSADERREVRDVRRMLERVPGSEHIRKYTGRDVAEGMVGGIVFSLPLLVEDGVFEIAEWLVEFWVGPVPLFLLVNSLFITVLVAGLLYYTDIRNVQVRLVFGFIPKRLVGILIISFSVAAVMMYMWGRLHEGDPSQLEMLGRVTVIWAAAAMGATLGDILPGESQGDDLVNLISEIGDGDEGYGGTE